MRGFFFFLFFFFWEKKEFPSVLLQGCSNVLPRMSNISQAFTFLKVIFLWEISGKFKIKACQKKKFSCHLWYYRRRANKSKGKYNIGDSLGKSKVLQFRGKFTSLRVCRENIYFQFNFLLRKFIYQFWLIFRNVAYAALLR